MRRLLITLGLVALMAVPTMAQEIEGDPLIFEMRGTFSNTEVPGQSFAFNPSFGLVADLGLPVTFGGVLTQAGFGSDTTQVLEAFVAREIRTWHMANGKSLKLEVYVGADVKKEQPLENRIYAMGIVYDAGLVDYMKVGVRGAFMNRDDGPNDWVAQGFIQIDAIK